MFTPPATADLASQPRKGFGARVASGFSRISTALRSAVACGLRRPHAGPDSGTAPTADRPEAASSEAPHPAHAGVLAQLTGRRRAPTAAQRRSQELSDAAFIDASFPGLRPDVRAFFNTPVEQCDPETLRIVLEALAGLIAGAMTPQDGMRDTQDVFLALSTRLAAAVNDAGQTPPAAVPEAVAAADAAATAALNPPAGSPGLAGAAPPGDPAAPPSDGTAVAQRAAAPASAAPDQAATAPIAPLPSGASAGDSLMPNAGAPKRGCVPPCHARHRSLRSAPGSARRGIALRPRNIIPLRHRDQSRHLPGPPRLLFYAACAGPPAPLRRAASGAPYRKACTGPSHGGPAIPIPAVLVAELVAARRHWTGRTAGPVCCGVSRKQASKF